MATAHEWQLPPGGPVTYLAPPVGTEIAYVRNPGGVVGVLDLAGCAVQEWTLPPALLGDEEPELCGIAPLRRGFALALRSQPALVLFEPAAGEFRLLHPPIAITGLPRRVASDPVGHVWASLVEPPSLWRLEPWSAHGVVRVLPPEVEGPQALALAGSSVWFSLAQAAGPVAAQMELRTSRLTLFEGPPAASYGIATGPRGEVWLTADALYRLTAGARPALARFPLEGTPQRVAVDAAGRAWFTTSAGRIGQARTTGFDVAPVEATPAQVEPEEFDFTVTAERARPAQAHAPRSTHEPPELDGGCVVEHPLAGTPFDVVLGPGATQPVFYSDGARCVIGALA